METWTDTSTNNKELEMESEKMRVGTNKMLDSNISNVGLEHHNMKGIKTKEITWIMNTWRNIRNSKSKNVFVKKKKYTCNHLRFRNSLRKLWTKLSIRKYQGEFEQFNYESSFLKTELLNGIF